MCRVDTAERITSFDSQSPAPNLPFGTESARTAQARCSSARRECQPLSPLSGSRPSMGPHQVVSRSDEPRNPFADAPLAQREYPVTDHPSRMSLPVATLDDEPVAEVAMQGTPRRPAARMIVSKVRVGDVNQSTMRG